MRCHSGSKGACSRSVWSRAPSIARCWASARTARSSPRQRSSIFPGPGAWRSPPRATCRRAPSTIRPCRPPCPRSRAKWSQCGRASRRKEKSSERLRQHHEGGAEAAAADGGAAAGSRQEESRRDSGRRHGHRRVQRQAGAALDQDRPRGHQPRGFADARGPGSRRVQRGAAEVEGDGPGRDGQAHRRSQDPRHGDVVAYYPEPVARLIEALQRLPGIGPKTAQRLTFFLLKRPTDEVQTLAESLTQLKAQIVHCRVCFNVTEIDPCRICADIRRDGRILCVVEEPNDLMALERTGEFRGRYHVLLGALSPLDGIGPEDLKVRELLGRLETPGVEEVILATNPSVEGEATAIYLAKLLRPLVPRITRIARGLPVGGDLEHAACLTGTSSHNLAASSQNVPMLSKRLPRIIESFRDGGGVSYSEYRPDFTEAMDASWRLLYDGLLIKGFLPAAKGLPERLEG